MTARALTVSALALAALLGASPAAAQVGMGQVDGDLGSGLGQGSGNESMIGDAAPTRPSRERKGKRLEVKPYIELNQIVTTELSPGNDVLTYTQAAVGLDASVAGRNTGASVSLRYARQIGWGRANDGDVISGIARGYAQVLPGLTLEAGGLATQGSFDGNGPVNTGADSTVYSVYAGPSLRTRAGDLDVSANYRIGYTDVDSGSLYDAVGGTGGLDVFSNSLSQQADVQAGFAPGKVAPVGLGVAGSFYQEDIANLDQRVRDMQARALVTVPINRTTQVVGAIGYEDVEISSRDVLYDGDGNPVITDKGRLVTDKSSPRVMAYDISGVLWDVAVMWRPSRRTSLTAHIGRRYGSTSFGGTLAYAPDDRKQLSLVVYDSVGGFGGQINRTLGNMPTDFEAVRDPVTGNLSGCVSSLDGSNCLSGVLGSLRSAAFRARGGALTYSMALGRLNAGIGLGYDRRRYFAAEGTILAAYDGVVDENYWVSAYLSGQLGSRAGWSANGYANWISSSDSLLGDIAGYGVSASYYQLLTPRLRGTLAVSLDGADYRTASIDDIWTASALAGLRYSF